MPTPALARMLVAEAVGAFALIFAACGAIMVDAKTHQLGHLGIALTFGLVIMAMIYAVGHISGVIGATVGGLTYQFVRGERPQPANEQA